MVAGAQYKNASQAEEEWKQHVGGTPSSSPAVEPLAPAKLTGSVFLVEKKPIPECTNFSASLENSTGSFVQKVAPNGAGSNAGMLEYFLGGRMPGNGDCLHDAAEHLPGRHGAGATAYNIPIPMSPQRQK